MFNNCSTAVWWGQRVIDQTVTLWQEQRWVSTWTGERRRWGSLSSLVISSSAAVLTFTQSLLGNRANVETMRLPWVTPGWCHLRPDLARWFQFCSVPDVPHLNIHPVGLKTHPWSHNGWLTWLLGICFAHKTQQMTLNRFWSGSEVYRQG